MGATAVVKLVTSKDDGDPGSSSTSSSPPQRFALKIVTKAKIVGQAQLTRLFREKELLGELRHPSIVDFHQAIANGPTSPHASSWKPSSAIGTRAPRTIGVPTATPASA